MVREHAGEPARGGSKLVEALTSARSWIYSAWVGALTLVVLAVVYVQATSDVTLIEITAVPEELKKQGFSSDVLLDEKYVHEWFRMTRARLIGR
jgi:predicted GNAT family acetyltransferase